MLKELAKRSKPTGITVEAIVVTPDLAKAWLEKNVLNRRVNQRAVSKIMRDIIGGRWQMTGDPIRFDTTGSLLDGQHRLLACVQADRPIETMVIYDMDPAIKTVVDTGRSRSASDVLSLRGITNSNNVASALRVLLLEKHERMTSGWSGIFTNADIADALDRHPNLPLYIPIPNSLTRGIVASRVGYLYYVTASILKQRERAEAMMAVLKTGVPNYDGCPIHAYREKMLRDYEAATGAHSLRVASFNALKHCWNVFEKGGKITVLRYPTKHVAINGLSLQKL